MDSKLQLDALDLGALIGSRICHDLVSPIGAIGNGVELLSMTGGVAAPELALISESVENANARIKFFRIAFGQSSEAQMIGRNEVQGILTDMYRGSRLKVNWPNGTDCSRREVQVAFLLLQCLETSMPYGGQIQVTRTDSNWRLQGDAEKMKQEPEVWAALGGDRTVNITANQVHFALVPASLARMGRKLIVDRSETRIVLSF